MRTYDVIVVGGGVIGSSIAFWLAREGVSVLLLERDRIGYHASRASAGMLTPLAESRVGDPGFDAGVESLELVPALIHEVRELSGIDPEWVASGLLELAFDARSASALGTRAASLERFGCEYLDADQARKQEPRISDLALGALWSPRESHISGERFARALASAAARRGAHFRLGTEVLGLRTDGDRVIGVRSSHDEFSAGNVVLANGAWAGLCNEWLPGFDIPVQPVKGQMVALSAPQPGIRHIVLGSDIYLVPRPDGTLRVGATSEWVGFDTRPTAHATQRLLRAAMHTMPSLADCTFVDTWAGLRPATPDELPLVGPVPGLKGLTLACGHYRRGILLAPVTGWGIAELILNQSVPDMIKCFDPGRFI